MRSVKGIKFAAAAVIALIAGIIVITQASAQLPTVKVGSATINPGSTGSVDLSARDIGPPGLGAWEIGITFDSSVVTATACDAQAGSVCNPNFASSRVQVTGANASGFQGTTVLATSRSAATAKAVRSSRSSWTNSRTPRRAASGLSALASTPAASRAKTARACPPSQQRARP